jgi:hypothetical protein
LYESGRPVLALPKYTIQHNMRRMRGIMEVEGQSCTIYIKLI